MRKRISRKQVERSFLTAFRRRTFSAFLLALLSACTYLYEGQHNVGQHHEIVHNGNAIVHDGDTLKINGESVRLFGIDAPELKQTCKKDGKEWACGEASRDYLVSLIGDKSVSCTHIGQSYNRSVGKCFVGDVELNREMVQGGFAMDYGHYTHDYDDAEAEAKQTKKGIWASAFEMPWDWRQRLRN
jgi:endonuclease YncB( thermonuclease family)